jgi:hypothetical protein
MKQFFIALVTLTLVHSAVSFGAYRLLTKTTVQPSTQTPPVETTTPEERTSGQSSFTMTYTKTVRRAVPTPIIFYMWAGYIGLTAAAVYALYFRLSHAQ